MARWAWLAAAGIAVVIGAPSTAKDRVGYQAITAQDYARAEQRLQAERRIFPQRPELMLNLAAVYERTGRAAQARALYAGVMEQPDVAMDLPNGASIMSHALAQSQLRALDPGPVALR